ERRAVLALAHERERPIRLAVEPADAGDEAGPARVEARQLHGALHGVGSVADEEALLQVARRELAEEGGQGTAQRVEQLLRRERHAFELRLHGAHDLRMVDAGRVDAVSAEAIDEAAPGDVLEMRAAAVPLDGRVLAALRDGLAIFEIAAVAVEAE